MPLLLAAAALLAGCGGGVVIGGIDCDSEMAELTAARGFPDEIERRVEGGVHIHTFLYLRAGLGITFVWSNELSCDRRDFVITPVR